MSTPRIVIRRYVSAEKTRSGAELFPRRPRLGEGDGRSRRAGVCFPRRPRAGRLSRVESGRGRARVGSSASCDDGGVTVSRAVSGVDVLAALDDDQRAAVTAMPGPVGILAGPGTGKTRTIAHRIAHAVQSGQWRPQQVLAVTFTNRAAAELRHRLRMLGVDDVSTGTFHAVALRQLRYFWPRLVGGAFPRIVADKTPFLTQAAGQLGVR